MSAKAFFVVVIAVAMLVAAGIYMHRPRTRAFTGVFPGHGDR